MKRFNKVEYIEADPDSDPLKILEQIYSKSQLRQLIKQNGIKIAKGFQTWIKVGQNYYIVTSSYHEVAQKALIWYEYHFELKPRMLQWQNIKG